jgi:hypothetical protein
MDYVVLKKIESPFSGEMCTPKTKILDYGDRIITEAWWYCPRTGKFVLKGVVSDEPKKKD